MQNLVSKYLHVKTTLFKNGNILFNQEYIYKKKIIINFFNTLNAKICFIYIKLKFYIQNKHAIKLLELK